LAGHLLVLLGAAALDAAAQDQQEDETQEEENPSKNPSTDSVEETLLAAMLLAVLIGCTVYMRSANGQVLELTDAVDSSVPKDEGIWCHCDGWMESRVDWV